MKKRCRLLQTVLSLLTVAFFAAAGRAETLHVDVRAGCDDNAGTADRPLATLARAALRVNQCTEAGPATILVAPGLYSLDRCVTLTPSRPFTEQDRLTIRAAILPDDPNWKPEHMPTLVSIENPPETARTAMPRETYSFKVQTSHVTIQGLRFLGNPSYRNWHCCIERIGRNLDDLLVTQCLFMGHRDTTDIYCAALATGDRFVVDHCVFSGCHACTVFWDGLDGVAGKGCAMRYCLVRDASISGVWTCQTAEDFTFHHNVVTTSKYLWMRTPGDRQTYRIHDCAIIGNEHLSGYGAASGPAGQTGPEVNFDETNIITSGDLVWTANSATGLARESVAYDLGAGLFQEH